MFLVPEPVSHQKNHWKFALILANFGYFDEISLLFGVIFSFWLHWVFFGVIFRYLFQALTLVKKGLQF